MKKRKGIILAGGHGSRLFPTTLVVSKQLLPIFNKPMIYYPLSILMLAGIREIAIITNPQHKEQFQSLLGDGTKLGIKIDYIEQPSPDGIAQALILSEEFLDGSPSVLILGDNIFYGDGLVELLKNANSDTKFSTVFCYRVSDPQNFGIISFDKNGCPVAVTEKPKLPSSDFAVTGMYFFDNRASEYASTIKPSDRGELEITSLLNIYIKNKELKIEMLGRGFSWLDTGTHESLIDASNFVRTIETRQGLLIGSPEEVALNQGWISKSQIVELAKQFSSNDYGVYLLKLGHSQKVLNNNEQ